MMGDQPGFETDAPRWRYDAAPQKLVERQRRLHNTSAPPQRGALDDDRSLAHDDAPIKSGQSAVPGQGGPTEPMIPAAGRPPGFTLYRVVAGATGV